jgi:hypothetical protein
VHFVQADEVADLPVLSVRYVPVARCVPDRFSVDFAVGRAGGQVVD